jgi:hypothetical protein
MPRGRCAALAPARAPAARSGKPDKGPLDIEWRCCPPAGGVVEWDGCASSCVDEQARLRFPMPPTMNADLAEVEDAGCVPMEVSVGALGCPARWRREAAAGRAKRGCGFRVDGAGFGRRPRWRGWATWIAGHPSTAQPARQAAS